MTQDDPEADKLLETLYGVSDQRIVSQNEIRRYMGLPPITIINASYHIDGVTDVSVFRKAAEKRRNQEKKPSWVHLHKKGKPCIKGCTLYRVKEGGEDGG